MVQQELDFSRQVTSEGIKRAVDHANAVHEGWSEQAYEFLVQYAKINPVFMAEDVRNASVGIVPEPPVQKAWGGILRKAAHARIIYSDGTRKVKNVKAHSANASLWKSLIVKR